ncbi:hypothetical protein NECAME_06160 [Necator americanus]|uniref:Uncharacterized protein n=1 Tax=Necator americanus TaxID=51031 RepID=W2TUY8_NECAM|nr:hypothetical protein NECAME_06160 [Necator americanus]ETN85915.1 hypothetical protein NECAME_06160 [Necator americanus]
MVTFHPTALIDAVHPADLIFFALINIYIIIRDASVSVLGVFIPPTFEQHGFRGLSILIVSMLKSIDEKDDEPLILTTNLLKTTNEILELDATQSDSTEENCYANLDPDKLVNAYGFGRYQMFGYFLCEFLNFFYSAALYVMPYVEANPVLECTYKVNKDLLGILI